MMIRAHIAGSGKDKGAYVKCPAKQKCRVASDADHVEFAGPEEMRMYNELADEGAAFDDDTVVSEILLRNNRSYGSSGRTAALAVRWSRDERDKLRRGEIPAKGEYDVVIGAVRNGIDGIWRNDRGLGLGHAPDDDVLTEEDRIAHSDNIVRTHGKWMHQFDLDYDDADPIGGRGTVYDPVYSDGDTMVAFADEGNGDGSNESMTVTTRQNPRSKVRYMRLDHGEGFDLRGNEVGTALNRITDCVDDTLEGYRDVKVDVEVSGEDGKDVTFGIRCKAPDGGERSMKIDQPMFERAFHGVLVDSSHEYIETLKKGFRTDGRGDKEP